MDDQFNAALLRLKEQLGLRTDREVAAALELSETAFNSRKARSAFPKDKLFALMAKRPELGLDAVYVLTGDRDAVTPQERARHNQMAEFTGRVEASPEDTRALADLLAEGIESNASVAVRRRRQYQLLEQYLNGVDDETARLIFSLVERLARDCAARGLKP